MTDGAIQTMRCFVAIDLSADVIGRLRAVQGDLRTALGAAGGPRVGWTSPAAMHLTLKFLGGDVDVGVAPAVADALRLALRGLDGFEIRLRGVGAFPRPSAARILWAGVSAEPPLTAAWQAVEAALEGVGFERERRGFAPHVTLGRLRGDPGDPGAPADVAAALAPHADRDLGACPACAVTLYRSTLTPKGPRYEALVRAGLRVAAGAGEEAR